jgi:hypothetical protein
VSSQAHKQAVGYLKIHVKRKKIYKEKTTTGTGSGYEQAQGHELWAHMLTFKLSYSSILMWKKIIYNRKNHRKSLQQKMNL